MSLLPTKSECRRCICTHKYVDSTTTRATSKSKKSKKKKRVKFPRPLQLTSTEKAKLRAAANAAALKAKLDALKPKEKIPFPEPRPLRPKLSGFAALKAAAERQAKKKAAKEAKARSIKNKDKFKVAFGPNGKPLPPGTKMVNGVMVDKNGNRIKLSDAQSAGRGDGGRGDGGREGDRGARGRGLGGRGAGGRGTGVAGGKGVKGGKRSGKGRKRRRKDKQDKGRDKSKGHIKGTRSADLTDKLKKKSNNISYPSHLNLKKWIPPYLLPRPPRSKINIDMPSFGTRKWIPPYLRKKKLRDKKKIDYPPLTFRKWIPPYLRRRHPRDKLKSLHGKSFRIAPSSLAKFWYRFKFIDDWYGIISGDYSQTYKKYGFKTNGYQAPCNCMVAMTISKLFRMKYWHKKFLNGVLDIGNGLYLESLRHLPSDVKPDIKVEQVYKSFYFGHTKITMTLSDTPYVGRVFKDYETDLYMRNILKKFFNIHYSGILIVNKRYRAVWKQGGKYFLFDPTEHDEFGRKWEEQPGCGYCYVVMFLTRDKMVDFIHESIEDTTVNYKFTLIACDILRTTEVVTDYPDCLLEFEDVPTKVIPKKDLDRLLPPPPEPIVEEPVEEDPEWLELEEVAPDAIPPDAPKKKNEIKSPFEKPKADSITYFSELVPGRQGILRASTYQTDPKFSKYKGQQSLTNAVSAIAMLRIKKSKKWTTTTLNNVLKIGEIVYHQSKKMKYKQEDLKFEHIVDKITIDGKDFMPVFEELVIMGKLQSSTGSLLDLKPALREYFSDNSTGILCGPISLAIWYEDGLFYMFDPDERDPNGNVIIRSIEVGSEIVFQDIPSGRACLTWYSELEDLIVKYMKNVDKSHRRDYFSVCKVEIKDYVPKYVDWNNFKALKESKWILRGSFSQTSKRFDKETRNTQCTAMAALAIAYTKILPLSEWTSGTIDEIITEGDLYYKNCVKTLKDSKKFLSSKLLVEELLRNTKIGDKDITFDIDDCVVNGIVSLKDEPTAKNLLQGCIEFFENNDNGILTAKSLSVSIWKFKDLYYLFDSHSRDEEGFSSNFGNACVLRFVNINEMVNCIEANFGVEDNCFYNISRVEPTISIVVGETLILPSVKNYMQIDDFMAILRGSLSDVSEEFGFNRGKQVVANCAVAAGMASLYPPLEWSSQTIDKILRRGDKLYQESKEIIYKEMIEFAKTAQTKVVKTDKTDTPKKGRRGGGFPLTDYLLDERTTSSKMTRVSQNFSIISRQLFERRAGGFPISLDVDPLDVDPIEDMNSDRLQTEFKIGVNKINVSFELINQSTVENDLEQKIIKYLEEPQIDDKDKKELLLETDHVTYYIFKDNNVYYLFTSQPCDHEGCFFGREEWKVPTLPLEIEEEEEEEEFFGSEITEEFNEETEQLLMTETYADNMFYQFPSEPTEEEMSVTFRHSSHYWRSMAEKDGRAFIAWFTQPKYLVKHILLNFPEEMKGEKYSLKRIVVNNNAEVKEYFNPKEADRNNPYDGDYYEFKEIERCRWILRGSFNQCYEMFPESNRGQQTIANCFTAIGFFHLYDLMTFKSTTVDNVLKYGDRLLTFTKKLRRANLGENKYFKLTPSQIDAIINGETFGINDIFKVFSIDEVQVTIEVEEYTVTGEINADTKDVIFNLPRGISKFFEENKFGILCAKDVCVAIIRGSSKMYYIFDPMSRGPSGIKCVNGVACITRFCDIESLANIVLLNLQKEGNNGFAIHKINVTSKPVPPPPPLPSIEQQPDPSLVGYTVVVPGKRIIRGTISQEDPQFRRGENVQSACMALVALAMSLIHRCCNWTRPIINEIVYIGDDVYTNALDKLGFSFNPWEQKMTLEYVPPDFVIGDLKANCELRDTTQTGIFNIKDPKIQNLRQSIERFFIENTHGVIESDVLTIAIWEDDYEHLIYIFDPNPRGPTGMPLMINGTACVIGCKDAKLAADHILSLLDDKSQLSFVIVPVEIIIGKNKKKCKHVTRNVRRTESTLERRRKAMEVRRKKENMRLEQLGRSQIYNIPGSVIGTLRGTRSQNSKAYSSSSRNNQDIPICLTAYVMERLLPLCKWTSKTIDQILDIGDQLYKDCFVINVPIDSKIGLDYVIRQVIIKDVKVHVAISKPVIINQFTYDNLLKGLLIYFMQKQFGLLSIDNEWIAIYFRDENYYLFDPHDRNLLGEVSIPGTAVLIKYPNLNVLANQLEANYPKASSFLFVTLGIKGIEKYEQTECRCGVDLNTVINE